MEKQEGKIKTSSIESDDLDIIPSIKSTPETRSWHEYAWKSKQEEPNRLEDAAKFLVGMVSITLTVFLSTDANTFGNIAEKSIVKAAVIAWLLSLTLAFLVLFPYSYRYASRSAKSIQNMHRKIVRRKRLFLYASVILFLVALSIVTGVFLV